MPLFAPGVDRAAALARLKASSVCTPTFQYLIFGLLFFGFAVKVPLFPLHSWLPDAHVEAPTPVSMILAGVLLKLGGYGLYRFAFPLAPWAASELAWYVGLLGAIGIVYGAIVAMGQTDFKKLLAYSSVSHMGYVVLGLAAWSAGSNVEYWEMGVNGAIFQMLAHGITAAGSVLRRRRRLRPGPPPRPEQARRADGVDAGVRRGECGAVLRQPRPARFVRVRRRVHGDPVGLELLLRPGDPGHPGHGADGRVPVVGLATGLPRHQPGDGEVPRDDAPRGVRDAVVRGPGGRARRAPGVPGAAMGRPRHPRLGRRPRPIAGVTGAGYNAGDNLTRRRTTR